METPEPRPLSSEEETIQATWSAHWKNLSESERERVDEWDSLSEICLQGILEAVGDIQGKSMMEAGCGTGRISAELAKRGAHVACLDITTEALDLARLNLKDYPDTRFIQGSILSVPRDTKYDIVWNSGVMEHFTAEDQRTIVNGFFDILNPGGKVIMLIPYALSIPYRLGKFVLEKSGKWQYGREIPYRTFADYMPARGRLHREYTISYLPFFLDLYKFCAPLKRPSMALTLFLVDRVGGRRFYRLDRAFCRLLGGYLLVSIVTPE